MQTTIEFNAGEFQKKIATQWLARREKRNLKKGTVTEVRACLEFFVGAITAAEALGLQPSTGVLMLIAVGRPVEQLLCYDGATLGEASETTHIFKLTVSIGSITVNANSRAQARKIAEDWGYMVHDVNMIG